MTIEDDIKRMEEVFGDLPDPLHQPKKFKYLMNLYFYLYK